MLSRFAASCCCRYFAAAAYAADFSLRSYHRHAIATLFIAADYLLPPRRHALFFVVAQCRLICRCCHD